MLLLLPSKLFAMVFPEEPIPMTVGVQSELISLEQADGYFERKWAINGLASYPLMERFNLIAKVHSAPDFGKDTAETSVFQSFFAVGALFEYSWVKLLRFYGNIGPSALYQKVTYEYESQEESFSHHSLALELNLGFDYAIFDGFFVSYSLGRRWRPSDDRLDKSQSLGVKLAL